MLLSLAACGRGVSVRRFENGSVGLVDIAEGGSGRTDLERATYLLDEDGLGPIAGPLLPGSTTVRLDAEDVVPVVGYGYWLAWVGSPAPGRRMVISHLSRAGTEVAREELEPPEEDEHGPPARRGRQRWLRKRLSRRRRMVWLLAVAGAVVPAAVALGGEYAASRDDDPTPPPGLEGGMTVYGPAGSQLPAAPQGIPVEKARGVAEALLDQARRGQR